MPDPMRRLPLPWRSLSPPLGFPFPPPPPAQPPADLQLACDRLCAGRIRAFKSAKAEDRVIRFSNDDPERETQVLLVCTQPIIAGAPFFGSWESAEPAHHRGHVHHLVEAELVLVVPSSKAETVGLRNDVSH